MYFLAAERTVTYIDSTGSSEFQMVDYLLVHHKDSHVHVSHPSWIQLLNIHFHLQSSNADKHPASDQRTSHYQHSDSSTPFLLPQYLHMYKEYSLPVQTVQRYLLFHPLDDRLHFQQSSGQPLQVPFHSLLQND